MKNSKITFSGLLSLFRKESVRVHPSGYTNSDDSVSSEKLQNDVVDFEAETFRMPRKISNQNRDRSSDPGSVISQDICFLDFSREKNVSSNKDTLALLVAELGELLIANSVAADTVKVIPDSDLSSNGTHEIERAPQKKRIQEVTVSSLQEDAHRDSFDLLDSFDELLLGIRDSLSLARKQGLSNFDSKNFEVNYSSDAEGDFCIDGFDEHLFDEVLLCGRRDSVEIALRRRDKK